MVTFRTPTRADACRAARRRRYQQRILDGWTVQDAKFFARKNLGYAMGVFVVKRNAVKRLSNGITASHLLYGQTNDDRLKLNPAYGPDAGRGP
jgi:hypothetical protein